MGSLLQIKMTLVILKFKLITKVAQKPPPIYPPHYTFSIFSLIKMDCVCQICSFNQRHIVGEARNGPKVSSSKI